MKIKKTIINTYLNLFFLFVIVLLSSCGRHTYYMPKESNLLQLKEQNDLKVALNGKVLNAPFSRVSAQVGYSPFKYVGIKVAYFDWEHNFEKFQLEQFLHSKYKSIALGGYYFLKQKSKYKNKYNKHLAPQRGLLFDWYGGVAKGSHLFKTITRASDYSFNYNNYFTQAGISFQGERIGVGLNFQYGILDILGGTINNQIRDEDADIIYGLLDNSIKPIKEVSFHLSWGIKQVRIYSSFALLAKDIEGLNRERIPTIRIGVVTDLDDVYDEVYLNSRVLRRWKSLRKRKKRIRKKKKAKKAKQKERREARKD